MRHAASPLALEIEALTFDLDDTLWEVWPVIAHAEERLHAWLAPRYPRIVRTYSPLDLRVLCREVAAQRPELDHDKSRLRIQALRLAAERCGYPPALAEQAFAVFYQARQEVELFEDVLPVLEALKNRYPMGALSNGNADVRLVGLDHVFDFHLSAIEVGIPKPDRAMFIAACERLSLPPGRVLHVGDDPDTDVRGAARAGMRTVWVNRRGAKWKEPDVTPDATVVHLFELRSLLGAQRP